MIEVGKEAPSFRLMSDEGQPIAPADFAGRKLVLFFYPKNFTSG